MRFLDFSSWQGALSTLMGLAVFLLIGIGLRLVFMMTIQQRQQRMNRQINERLKALMAAYKVLGGSFTGNLTVDPSHGSDRRRRERENVETAADRPAEVEDTPQPVAPAEPVETVVLAGPAEGGLGAPPESVIERRRQIRDAVEAALSDIFLLGTEEHVRLAQKAASELVAGHPVQTHELVVALRAYIRKALDLEPIPEEIIIPPQGPTRPSSQAGRGQRGGGQGGGQGGGGQGGGGGAAGGGGGMGMGMGLGMGGAGRDGAAGA